MEEAELRPYEGRLPRPATSRSEKRHLKQQHEERCIEDAMEAAELRPCEGYSVPGLATEGLERHEERCVVNEMGRSAATAATALRGLITSQIPDVEARSGVWNDLGSPP